MNTKLNFRSVVFKRAYLIVKKTGCSFSEALKEAWIRYRNYKQQIVEDLKSRIEKFDTYYYMSDDNRVYSYWSNIQSEIRNQLVSLPVVFSQMIESQLSRKENMKSFIK